MTPHESVSCALKAQHMRPAAKLHAMSAPQRRSACSASAQQRSGATPAAQALKWQCSGAGLVGGAWLCSMSAHGQLAQAYGSPPHKSVCSPRPRTALHLQPAAPPRCPQLHPSSAWGSTPCPVHMTDTHDASGVTAPSVGGAMLCPLGRAECCTGGGASMPWRSLVLLQRALTTSQVVLLQCLGFNPAATCLVYFVHYHPFCIHLVGGASGALLGDRAERAADACYADGGSCAQRGTALARSSLELVTRPAHPFPQTNTFAAPC